MKILFVHQNFPGQFKFLAPALAAQGHDVTAMTMQKVQADAVPAAGLLYDGRDGVAHVGEGLLQGL